MHTAAVIATDGRDDDNADNATACSSTSSLALEHLNRAHSVLENSLQHVEVTMPAELQAAKATLAGLLLSLKDDTASEDEVLRSFSPTKATSLPTVTAQLQKQRGARPAVASSSTAAVIAHTVRLVVAFQARLADLGRTVAAKLDKCAKRLGRLQQRVDCARSSCSLAPTDNHRRPESVQLRYRTWSLRVVACLQFVDEQIRAPCLSRRVTHRNIAGRDGSAQLHIEWGATASSPHISNVAELALRSALVPSKRDAGVLTVARAGNKSPTTTYEWLATMLLEQSLPVSTGSDEERRVLSSPILELAQRRFERKLEVLHLLQVHMSLYAKHQSRLLSDATVALREATDAARDAHSWVG